MIALLSDWHMIIFAIDMNFERFIASRLNRKGGTSFTRLIVHIAITAIALSMMVMIISTTVITGFKNQIAEKVFNFWGHIHVTSNLASDSFELVPVELDQSLIDSLLNIEEISYVRPRSFLDDGAEPPIEYSKGGISAVEKFLVVPSIVAYKSQFEGLLLKGLDDSFNQDRINSFIQEGEFITFPDSISSRDIMISQNTAKRMNFVVGQKVNVSFIIDGTSTKRQFSICGIYKTGLDEYDRRFALIDMRILQDLLGWSRNQVSGLEIFIEDLDDLDLLNDYIHFELLPPATSGESVTSKFYSIFEWLQLQNVNERVINILMILVALINMVTALLIFVLERSTMIGVLKALGATNWSIRKIFLYNAARIILIGILIGNAAAIGICLLQKYTGLMKLNEADYYLSVVPIEFNFLSILMINIGTIIVVLLFLIIPSLIVSKISPVKTIQFK